MDKRQEFGGNVRFSCFHVCFMEKESWKRGMNLDQIFLKSKYSLSPPFFN